MVVVWVAPPSAVDHGGRCRRCGLFAKALLQFNLQRQLGERDRGRMRVSEGEVIEGRLPQKPSENGEAPISVAGKLVRLARGKLSRQK